MTPSWLGWNFTRPFLSKQNSPSLIYSQQPQLIHADAFSPSVFRWLFSADFPVSFTIQTTLVNSVTLAFQYLKNAFQYHLSIPLLPSLHIELQTWPNTSWRCSSWFSVFGTSLLLYTDWWTRIIWRKGSTLNRDYLMAFSFWTSLIRFVRIKLWRKNWSLWGRWWECDVFQSKI